MRISEETTLGVAVAHAYVGVEVVSGIPQRQTAVALAASSVAQTLVFQLYPIGIILYAVCRNLVVRIVYESHVGAVEEPAVSSADFCRYAQLLVVTASEELDSSLEGLARYVVGIEVYHSADSVAAI